MGSTTTNLSLYKPAEHEDGWSDEVNASLDTIDAQLWLAINGTEQLVRYVSPTGNDSNSGHTPLRPMETIQAAYNSLKTYAEATYTALGGNLGCGTIILSPGMHDVGAGVTITRNRPVLIKGTRSGVPMGGYAGEWSSLVYSSGTPTQLISYGAGQQSNGLEIEDVAFRVSASQTSGAIKLVGVNHFRAERCSCQTNTGLGVATSFVTVNNDAPAGDGSWGKIINCFVQQCGLLYVNTTGQFNYWTVRDNYNTIGLVASAGIYLSSTTGIVACEVSGNHFESGPAAAGPSIYTRGAYNCTFIHNYGEQKDVNFPFYDFGGANCTVVGGRDTSDTSGTAGYFVKTTTTADYNTFIMPHLRPASDTTASQMKDRFLDQNTASRNKWIGNEFFDIEKGWFDMEARAVPSNPPSGFRRLFSDNGASSAASVRTNTGTTTSLET